MNVFWFGVYPYLCLSSFTLGLVFRYLATPQEWNARSSNLFARKSLMVGSYIFHYAIIFAFFGHVFGLLTPTVILNGIGFTHNVHEAVAGFAGKFLAVGVVFGLTVLLWRHFASRDVWATTVVMDIVVVCFILFQGITGGCQDFFSNFNVFDTVAPWIKGILTFRPHPELMDSTPVFIKLHVICGFSIFAMVPFSRLVHFLSVPVLWCLRPLIQYRRRYENL